MNSKKILKKIRALSLDDWIENKLLAKKSLSSTKNVKPSIINTNNPGTRV
jgi:hypothetical protein